MSNPSDSYRLVYRSFGAPADRLRLEREPLAKRPGNMLRVEMLQAPVNPSDLIPITGAYAHRINVPAVAGYEGVGRVVSAPPRYASWIGQRVLPLRGPGTWQTVVDCAPEFAVRVPEHVGDSVAARAYINPLAASEMLASTALVGSRVLLSGAGSYCSDLLGYGALRNGAASVAGIYRSEVRAARLRWLGIRPISAANVREVLEAARAADVTFDSLGGELASQVLGAMRAGSRFVGYGLLTGRPIDLATRRHAKYERFHLRGSLQTMDNRRWQMSFVEVWDTLARMPMPAACLIPFENWQRALTMTAEPGASKPILKFKND